jgi:hypothetical protein
MEADRHPGHGIHFLECGLMKETMVSQRVRQAGSPESMLQEPARLSSY